MKKLLFILVLFLQLLQAWGAEDKLSGSATASVNAHHDQFVNVPAKQHSPADVTYSITFNPSAARWREEWLSHDCITAAGPINYFTSILSYRASECKQLSHLLNTRLLLFPKHFFW